jgi:hypothetical protein
MKQKGVVFTTSLSVKQCADLFRNAAESTRGIKARMSEVAASAMGNSETVGYYTPSFDSPFAAVDGVPDFAIGFNVLKFMGGGQGNGTHVHMYVDDQGSERNVQLVSGHGLTGAARSARCVSIFMQQFQSADRALRVVDGNI